MAILSGLTISGGGLTISSPIPVTPTVEYLVVAGGGGGGGGLSGAWNAGGGGAGGLLANSFSVTSSVTYSITVGAGGAGGNAANGTTGQDSVVSGSGLTTITAFGGGGGGSSGNGLSGGSGGGGGGPAGTTSGGSGTAGQGFAGGSSPGGYNGQGGGGAGAVGYPTGTGIGAYSSITGTSVGYAAGGSNPDSTTYGAGYGNGVDGTLALANRGGGGAWGYAAPQRVGAAGGSGVVIIRYSDGYLAASATTGSPTITVADGYRVYKYTSSGSITF